MALCSATEVKNHLVISGSAYDTVIGQLITQVEKIIEAETGVRAVATAYDSISNEINRSYGGRRIWGGKYVNLTKLKPVRDITAVYYRDANGDWTEYTTETAGDIEESADKNQYYTKYVVADEGEGMQKVSYTCGYKTSETPSDLKLCAILMVVGLFNQRQGVGFKSQSVLGYSMQLDDQDYLYVKKILTKYKNITVL